jgi:hypothetical protein
LQKVVEVGLVHQLITEEMGVQEEVRLMGAHLEQPLRVKVITEVQVQAQLVQEVEVQVVLGEIHQQPPLVV